MENPNTCPDAVYIFNSSDPDFEKGNLHLSGARHCPPGVPAHELRVSELDVAGKDDAEIEQSLLALGVPEEWAGHWKRYLKVSPN